MKVWCSTKSLLTSWNAATLLNEQSYDYFPFQFLLNLNYYCHELEFDGELKRNLAVVSFVFKPASELMTMKKHHRLFLCCSNNSNRVRPLLSRWSSTSGPWELESKSSSKIRNVRFRRIQLPCVRYKFKLKSIKSNNIKNLFSGWSQMKPDRDVPALKLWWTSLCALRNEGSLFSILWCFTDKTTNW